MPRCLEINMSARNSYPAGFRSIPASKLVSGHRQLRILALVRQRSLLSSCSLLGERLLAQSPGLNLARAQHTSQHGPDRCDALRQARNSFLFSVFAGVAELDDIKMALALKCQRARNLGYDANDGRWEALMEEMAACKFEGADGDEAFAAAIRERLDEKPNEPKGINALNILAASAFNSLDFVEKGL